MDTNLVLNSSFNDLVFENRHKNYGAYMIRKRYRRNVLIAALLASSVMLFFFVGYFSLAPKAVAAVKPKHADSSKVRIITVTTPPDPQDPPKISPPPKGPESASLNRIQLVDSTTAFKMDSAGASLKGVAGGIGPKQDTCTNCGIGRVDSTPRPPVVDTARYVFTDELPDCPDMGIFFEKNVHYPQMAKEQGIQGTVYLQFVVNQDGKITDISILKGVHPLLDKEVLRVAEKMPNCMGPAKMNGKPVRFLFRKPVKFTLH